MTRVDFYILQDSDLNTRIKYAFRIAEKALHNKQTVYVHTDNKHACEEFQQRSWAFRPDAFLPFELLSEDTSPDKAPLCIGAEQHCGSYSEVLINLSGAIPTFFSRFERLFEIVVQEPTVLASTRNNYRFYKDRGYPLHNNKL